MQQTHWVVICILVSTTACERFSPQTEAPGAPSPIAAFEQSRETLAMQLHGPFQSHSRIDGRFTGEGSDDSPPLSWSKPPVGTKSFVVICDDPDAPSPKRPAADPWVHWVIYNIPASASALPEKIARVAEPAQIAGARQGKNSWPSDNVGYRGPMPPPGSGEHRYFFKLYALDCELGVSPASATKSAIVSAMRGHVLGEAELVGSYERK